MRFKRAIVWVGVVGLATATGCTKTKPADRPAQQPPEVVLGEQVTKDAPRVPPKPTPKAEAVDGGEPVAKDAPKVPPKPAPKPDAAEKPADNPAPPPATETPKGAAAAPAGAAADAAAPGAAAVADLVARLSTAADEDGRVKAIDDLAALGQNALPAMEKLLAAAGDENVRVRWHAARALGAIGEDALPAIGKLVSLLRDADPIVATQAAAAIGAIRADDDRKEIPADALQAYAAAAGALAEATVHPDARVRRASLRAVSRLEADPAKLAPLVNRQLADAEPAVVMESLQSLADLGADAVPLLIESLKDPKARYWATVALTEIGPDAAPAAAPLTAAAVNGETEERLQAMLALAAIGEPAAEAADELATVLDSPDAAVRSAAAFALGRMRGAAADAALEKASTDADPFLSGIASWARARIHPEDKALVSKSLGILTGALDGDRPNARIAAMSAISDLTDSLDDADEAAVAEKFATLLGDANPEVRGAAATALVRLGPTAVAALEKSLANPEVRTLAVELLAASGSKAKEAVDTLVVALGDADPAHRGDAAVALAAIGPDAAEAVPALVKVVEGGAADDASRYPAIFALGRIGAASAPATALLRGLMAKADDPMGQAVSAWALLKITPDDEKLIAEAVPLLRKGLRSERDLVRLEAVAALAELGKAAASAVPMLELMSEDDPLPAVRKAAAAAAARIKAAK